MLFFFQLYKEGSIKGPRCHPLVMGNKEGKKVEGGGIGPLID